MPTTPISTAALPLRRTAYWLALMAAASLAACGGGGGDAAPPAGGAPAPAPAPGPAPSPAPAPPAAGAPNKIGQATTTAFTVSTTPIAFSTKRASQASAGANLTATNKDAFGKWAGRTVYSSALLSDAELGTGVDQLGTINCTVSGTLTRSWNDRDGNGLLTQGDTFTLTANDCVNVAGGHTLVGGYNAVVEAAEYTAPTGATTLIGVSMRLTYAAFGERERGLLTGDTVVRAQVQQSGANAGSTRRQISYQNTQFGVAGSSIGLDFDIDGYYGTETTYTLNGSLVTGGERYGIETSDTAPFKGLKGQPPKSGRLDVVEARRANGTRDVVGLEAQDPAVLPGFALVALVDGAQADLAFVRWADLYKP